MGNRRMTSNCGKEGRKGKAGSAGKSAVECGHVHKVQKNRTFLFGTFVLIILTISFSNRIHNANSLLA